MDDHGKLQGLGSAIVPIAVGRVSRPTPSPIDSCEFLLGLAAKRRQSGMCLAGRQTPRAGRTRSPRVAFARSDPLTTSRNQKGQGCAPILSYFAIPGFKRNIPLVTPDPLTLTLRSLVWWLANPLNRLFGSRTVVGQSLNINGANSWRLRRQVCHSCAVPGEI